MNASKQTLLLKRILIWLVGILLFFFLLDRFSRIIRVWGTDPGDPDRRTTLFYDLPKDRVDCVFAGSSHSYCTFIPKQLFEDAGIASASLATSSQSMQNTYWLLNEMYHKQSPQLVVLDIYSILAVTNPTVMEFRLRYTSGISILPDLSPRKPAAYLDILHSDAEWVSNMTPYDAYGFLEYRGEYRRDRYPVTEFVNLFFSPAREYDTFGFYPTTTVYPLEELSEGQVDQNNIDFTTLEEYQYLNQIYELLQRHGTKLLLVRAPYSTPEDNYCHLYEQILAWAEEHQVPVIDYFALIEETRINLATDFRDEGHLNYLGARKATAYLLEYLTEHYTLPDHRGDSRYALWEENDYDYTAVEEQILRNLSSQ